MENDDSTIEIIKIKVKNTLNLSKINRNVLGWVEDRIVERPSFRAHYYSPYELSADIKCVKNLDKQKTLIEWLRKQKTKDPIIKQTLNYLEKE